MATRALLRDRPNRAVALVTATHALILRHSAPSTQASGPPSANPSAQNASLPGNVTACRCIVEFLPIDKADLSGYRVISNHNILGTLGFISIDNDVFLCLVSGATKAATVRPGETVQRILNVDFHCLNKPDYDHVLHDNINQYPTDTLDEEGYEQEQVLGRRDPPIEHPCLALKKLLSGGSFYYSADFDLTNRLQDRSSQDAATFDFDSFDQGYLWNSYMIQSLVDFRSRLSDQDRSALDNTRLLTFAIRGFALTIQIPAYISPARENRNGPPSSLTLISRLSCRRAGTRFNARGIDDGGNVANFVETETLFWTPSGTCFSYVQVRGSVPLFWEQTAGLLPQQQKVNMTRSKQATQPAFDRHFEDLEMKYGPIHVVNLLSKDKSNEVELGSQYHAQIVRSSLNKRDEDSAPVEYGLLRDTWYDFHAETKAPGGFEAANGIKLLIQESADGFAYCLTELEDQAGEMDEFEREKPGHSIVVLQQEGVFRTNCLDCLDRTNLIQTIVSQMAFDEFLAPRGDVANPEFLGRHRILWADNGDALSKIYAGTGAIKSSFTRTGKQSIAGYLADARKSATRMYINNFADQGRQNVMDILLGRLYGQSPVYLSDPINDYVNSELIRRVSEYSSTAKIRIWAGTFNLNGRLDGINGDLTPWLLPSVSISEENPEIVAVGFQEIVELSPQQMMSTEPTRRQEWEKVVKRTLNNHAEMRGSEKYVLLRGGQLVGASLSIFVKTGLLGRIKNAEGSLKKTGMSGMAGNKGAVAIRMDIDNTSMCFVTAHLAAGFANYEDRNRDFKTINHGLKFQRNRLIDDHDAVIWLGDFNYRIGLANEKARKLAAANDFGALYENDQLNLQMIAGLTFPYYSENRIMFKPTYKYDLGSDDYDTSEKGRIPAWTDRILRKGNSLRQISYNAAPLRFSDHRPVYGTFVCTVSIVDEKVKNSLSKQIYDQRRAVVGDSTANTKNDDPDDEDLLGYESIEPGLPPASSDRRKWWLDNGIPARSKIQPPGQGFMANPERPSNPFSSTDQPDWITDSPITINSSSPGRNRGASSSSSQRLPNTHRKLPPPFDPSGSSPATTSRILDGASESTRYRSPSISSNFSTYSSNSTTISRKPAPPIPKKPAQFTTSPQATSPINSNSSQWFTELMSHSPIQPQPSSSSRTTTTNFGQSYSSNNMTFPPPPRRNTGRESVASSSISTSQAGNGRFGGGGGGGVGGGGGAGAGGGRQTPKDLLSDDDDEPPPALPPRRGTGLMDGGDEGGGGLSGWAVLKPS